MRILTEGDARPLVDGLRAGAVVLASRRDGGGGVVVARDRTDIRRRGLSGAGALVVRQELGSIVAWLVGIAAGGFALGWVAEVVDQALSRSTVDVLHRFG